MKTCNSSRVVYLNRPHQNIINNVPIRLEGDSSSEITRQRCSSLSTHPNSNRLTRDFSFRNFPLIIQGILLFLTLASTFHLSTGSHLPSSYIVQKINSNNDYKIVIRNVSSHEDVAAATSTTSDGSSTTTRIPETSTNTIVTPEEETNPLETILDTLASLNDVWTGTTSAEVTSSPPETTATSTSSYEDNNDFNLNYISEHDHYDEYAAMKAALDKEKMSAEEAKQNEVVVGVERRPFLLQGADGRKYASIEAVCDDRHMTISGQFDDMFKGRIYALGYSDEVECGANNAKNISHNISFSLPLGSCGVQMLAVDDNLENDLRHEVTLYIQYSAFLQQVVDEKISVSCTEIKRNPVEEFVASNEQVLPSSRQGRRMGNLGDAGKYGTTKISSRIGEAWMEILAGKDPSPKSRKLSPVSVGEDVTLVISTKVLRGYDARIVNCSAHDGSRAGTLDGSRAQQILDSAGCSLDRSLVPNLRRRRLPIESRNRLITLHFATFPAFKFPERDHLHIKCAVAYCQGPCPQEPCDSVLNHFGSWRDKYGRIADVLIDSTEVVNSVEVIAPELDDLGRGQHYERQSSVSSGSYSSLSNGNGLTPALPSEVSGRQFPSEPTSSYSSYSSSNGASNAASAAPSAAAASGQQSMYGNSHQMNPGDMHGPVGSSVCVSPGTVILALVILGVVLVISATATLWFALKRSEAKKYRHLKHSPFQHGPQPYYRFSHW